MIQRLLLIIFIFLNTLFAQVDNNDTNLTQADRLKILDINEKINNLDEGLKNNIWLIGYQNYITYQELIDELTNIDEDVAVLSKKRDQKSKLAYSELLKEQDRLEKQIQLLSEYKNSPFIKIVKPEEITKKPSITNPIEILFAFSYIKSIEQDQETYKQKIDSLNALLVSLKNKEELLKEINTIHTEQSIEDKINMANQEVLDFNRAHDLADTTFKVYSKKVDTIRLEVQNDIKAQMKRAFDIGFYIILVILVSLLAKYIIKKYISDNERFYMANKAINLLNFTLIVLIVLFAYIENVSYFVTILGFASAGIAIAMKDWFMSVLGWMVIVFGGSFHVGDRIKVQKDGLSYVGDIIDISLLRMTILEDVTLTTYLENRRSGRVVFIPNNYVFTTLISNYTHGTLKTVWDGIDLTITFDSNHKKAVYLIKNITKKYSKGYTDIARRGLNQLRSQYSLKNTNVEPRTYSFLEPHGLTISTWYMTNSYAALTLRSTISAEIVDAINKEEDIKIAYPTQTIDVRQANRKMPTDMDVNKDVLY